MRTGPPPDQCPAVAPSIRAGHVIINGMNITSHLINLNAVTVGGGAAVLVPPAMAVDTLIALPF